MINKEYFTQSYYFDKVVLKAEYRRLSKIYHPDKGGSDTIMAEINRQHEILQNQTNKSDHYKIKPTWTRKEIIDLLKDLNIDFIIDSGKIMAKGKNVYNNKDKLKNVYGFWWDNKNGYWYWTKQNSRQKTG